MIHGALKALRTHVHHSNDALFRLVVPPDRTVANLSRYEFVIVVVL